MTSVTYWEYIKFQALQTYYFLLLPQLCTIKGHYYDPHFMYVKTEAHGGEEIYERSFR